MDLVSLGGVMMVVFGGICFGVDFLGLGEVKLKAGELNFDLDGVKQESEADLSGVMAGCAGRRGGVMDVMRNGVADSSVSEFRIWESLEGDSVAVVAYINRALLVGPFTVARGLTSEDDDDPFCTGIFRSLNPVNVPFAVETLRSPVAEPFVVEIFRVLTLTLEPTLEFDIDFAGSKPESDVGGADTLREGIEVPNRLAAGKGDTIGGGFGERVGDGLTVVFPLSAVKLLVSEALETVRGLPMLDCPTTVEDRVDSWEKRVDESEGGRGFGVVIAYNGLVRGDLANSHF
jgi:hypothetical protein